MDEELVQKIQNQCKISKQKTSQFIAMACEHELNAIEGESTLKSLFSVDSEKVLQALETLNNIQKKLDSETN